MDTTTHPPDGRDTSKILLSDIQTRLAVIEEKQRTSELDRAAIRKDVGDVDHTINGMDNKLDEVLREFNQMKGKIGGVIWVLGALVTALSLFGDKILKFFSSGNWT